MSTNTILYLGTGKMSTFGGPADTGCAPSDGLALVEESDLNVWWYASLFLSEDEAKAPGLARRLNPDAFYLAMRWDEVLRPFGRVYPSDDTESLLRHSMVRLTNPRNNISIFARAVDYGPGDGKVVDGVQDPDTGRLADLSPCAAKALGLITDQDVTCELILPEVES